MRILAIGDIHGCSRALETLLRAVRPQPEDTVVTLGDYVDRGPDSRNVLERLIGMHADGNLVALRGNHEIMMLGARDHADMDFQWRRSGGEETLASYNAREVGAIPPAHWKFIEETCVDWWEARTHFFVHANAYPDFPLEEQPTSMLFWEKFNRPAPHASGKVMVCGHTSQKSGLPINIGHAVCLDTRAAKGGWLSCLDTGSGRLWQANQRGEVRKMWLDEV